VSLLALSAGELLDRFASPDPTPGGGSAAAWAGATGAALVAMVCAMAKTRTGETSERARLDEAGAAALAASDALRRLVDEDTAAYAAVVDAYRMAKGTEDEKAVRKRAIAAALVRATEVPLRTAEACLRVLTAAQEAAAHGNPNARSDAVTGAWLAWAGLVGAVENVRVNAAGRAEGGSSLAQAEHLRREGRARVAHLGLD
jgi:formiminotetrahydrofolate cyclodeaminase